MKSKMYNFVENCQNVNYNIKYEKISHEIVVKNMNAPQENLCYALFESGPLIASPIKLRKSRSKKLPEKWHILRTSFRSWKRKKAL